MNTSAHKRSSTAYTKAMECIALVAVGFVSLAGCASDRERSAKSAYYETAQAPGRERWSASYAPVDAHGKPRNSRPTRPPTGQLSWYVARAMQHSPTLRASFHRFQADVEKISVQRRLPDPVVSFGYYVQSVETRVGPQVARVGLKQTIPWPGQLSARAEAQAEQASASQRRFDAEAVIISREVASHYYDLWEVRKLREVHREHLALLRQLSESVQARVETGQAELVDLQQIHLAIVRVDDELQGSFEKEKIFAAELQRTIGTTVLGSAKTNWSPPKATVPEAEQETLTEWALLHPALDAYEHLAASKERGIVAVNRKRLPTFSVGVDWILTGQAVDPAMPDSGKDAVVVGGSMSVPIFQGSHDHEVSSARAEAKATRYDKQTESDRRVAATKRELALVADTARRVALHERTLLPQATTTLEAVVGSYAAGRSSISALLMAQEAALRLEVDAVKAHVRHAQAWAALEQVTGRHLDRRPYHENEK